MSAILYATRLSVLTKRAVLPASTIIRQASVEAKEKFQYPYDKSYSQQFIEKRTKKIQEFQKFLDVSSCYYF